MIKISHLYKYHGRELLLEDVCITLEDGLIHGFVGKNASGKTALMKCIAGLIPPDRGSIRINKKALVRDIETPPRMGILLGTPGFLPEYSGLQNLRFLAEIQERIDDNAIFAAMERVGLDPNSRIPVSVYNPSDLQRLGIAQAIMENPRLLILDEPMAHLDDDAVKDVQTLLRELRSQGKTILITGNGNPDVRHFCDHVYNMYSGSLTQLF